MDKQETNPRFLEIARRQKNEGFLEAEARKAEDFRKLKEEERIRVREEIARKRIERLEGLMLKDKRLEEFTSYIGNLNAFEGDELETSINTYVNHPDFPLIYNQLSTIPTVSDKWGFLVRRAYEIGQDVEVFIGNTFQNNPVSVKRRMEDFGIYLLCPYFEDTNRELHPKNDCAIDSKPMITMCDGIYGQCVVFRDRAEKSAAGLLSLPVINRTEPKINIPKIEVDTVDLEDLDNWWKMEGKYD